MKASNKTTYIWLGVIVVLIAAIAFVIYKIFKSGQGIAPGATSSDPTMPTGVLPPRTSTPSTSSTAINYNKELTKCGVTCPYSAEVKKLQEWLNYIRGLNPITSPTKYAQISAMKTIAALTPDGKFGEKTAIMLAAAFGQSTSKTTVKLSDVASSYGIPFYA